MVSALRPTVLDLRTLRSLEVNPLWGIVLTAPVDPSTRKRVSIGLSRAFILGYAGVAFFGRLFVFRLRSLIRVLWFLCSKAECILIVSTTSWSYELEAYKAKGTF